MIPYEINLAARNLSRNPWHTAAMVLGLGLAVLVMAYIPSTMVSFYDDIIDKANRALAGMGDLLAGQAAKIGAQGTFNAANVLGLQAGGATDRMANGIDKIERNTRPLRNAQELSFA